MPAPRQSSIRVVAFASLIGTTIEWYDYFLYGTAAALVFNRLFFPTFDPLSGTLISLATYSVGFIARPVGGIVIGHYGDKGRLTRVVKMSQGKVFFEYDYTFHRNGMLKSARVSRGGRVTLLEYDARGRGKPGQRSAL